MILNFSAKKFISYDAKTASESLSEEYNRIAAGAISFPLNMPGTPYHRALKVRDYVCYSNN